MMGITNRHKDCLMPKQTDFIYKKVELGTLINKNTLKDEIDTDADLNKIDDNNGDENPYRELVVNNASRIEILPSPIEHWSILSNVINYMQHSKNPLSYHLVMVRPARVSRSIKKKETGEITPRVELIESPSKTRTEYLDRYDGIKTEIIDTVRFDENSDLSTTYLGKINLTQSKDLW